MTARALAMGLLFSLAPGCYLVHGNGEDGGAVRDAATTRDGSVRRDAAVVGEDVGTMCAAPGTYDTPVRFLGVDPPGCFSTTTDVIPIGIPPRVEDFGAMCDGMSGRVVEIAPCQWSIDVECMVPDASTSTHGVIDALGGSVHGQLEVTFGSFSGECRGTVVLGN